MKTRSSVLALLFASTVACSGSASPSSSVPTPTVTPVTSRAKAQVDSQKSTFAAEDSDAILAAALEYPPALIAAEPAPPMSLTASDGTGLSLVAVEANTVIDGPLAFTELQLRFQNPRDTVIEGRFAITLPPGAAISRMAMHLEGTGWQEAEVVELQLARRAYEDFLHRRQDPALLEKEAGNEFRARIFPIPARGTKDIIISYSQALADDEAVYTLPLRGLPKVDSLSVNALVGKGGAGGQPLAYERVTLEHKAWTPDRDFEVNLQSGVAGLRHGELVAVRVTPTISADVDPIDSLVVLFDTSASRALGFSSQVQRLGTLIDGLRAVHGDDMNLAVATFDQAVMPVYEGKASGFGKADLDAILARRPLGASNLHGALEWAAASQGYRRVLVVSDAIATMGADGADEIRAAAAAMKGQVDRIDAVLTGGIRDEELAGRLVRGTVATDGVVLTGALTDDEIARRIGQQTRSGITVAVDGADWVWPKTLDGFQPGDDALVFARLNKKAKTSATVRLGGTIDETVTVELADVAEPLIERAAANAQITMLTYERDSLDRTDARRATLQQQIIDVSTRYRVLSDFTALLVLETDDDYARFGIDRTALADIMTVGKDGIEVFSRAKPVVMVVPDEPVTEKNTGKKDTKAKKKPAKAEDMDDMSKEMEKLEEIDDKTSSMDFESDDADEPARSEPPPAPSPRRAARRPAAVADPEPAAEAVAHEDSDAYGAMSGDEVAGSYGAGVSGTVGHGAAVEVQKPSGPPAYTGKMADIMALIDAKNTEKAVVDALAWRTEEPGDVMALIALGEALEARGNDALAARAYGSIIDLFPSRADMRRFAGERLEGLASGGAALAADSYAKSVAQRPDHLTGHRLLGYALLRDGKYADAFDALAAGAARNYPEGRFASGKRILREDLGLIAAAWLAARPADKAEIEKRLAENKATLATTESLRFVLTWETDANDVDFHIYDGKGGHAFYSQKQLASGGELYADITNGYGPECFTIEGPPQAYPYNFMIHYYSRGPMGYGMGKLEVIRHDGNGGLEFEERPFVVMNDGAYVDLGTVTAETGNMIAR